MRLIFIPLALLAALGVLSAELAPPDGCVPPIRKSGVACPGSPAHAIAYASTVAEASTGQLVQISDFSLLQDTFDWLTLSPPRDNDQNDFSFKSPTPPFNSTLQLTTLTVSAPNPDNRPQGDFYRQVQSDPYFGGFPDDMQILISDFRGELTLTFSPPISAFATYIDVSHKHMSLHRSLRGASWNLCNAYAASH